MYLLNYIRPVHSRIRKHCSGAPRLIPCIAYLTNKMWLFLPPCCFTAWHSFYSLSRSDFYLYPSLSMNPPLTTQAHISLSIPGSNIINSTEEFDTKWNNCWDDTTTFLYHSIFDIIGRECWMSDKSVRSEMWILIQRASKMRRTGARALCPSVT